MKKLILSTFIVLTSSFSATAGAYQFTCTNDDNARITTEVTVRTVTLGSGENQVETHFLETVNSFGVTESGLCTMIKSEGRIAYKLPSSEFKIVDGKASLSTRAGFSSCQQK